MKPCIKIVTPSGVTIFNLNEHKSTDGLRDNNMWRQLIVDDKFPIFLEQSDTDKEDIWIKRYLGE